MRRKRGLKRKGSRMLDHVGANTGTMFQVTYHGSYNNE